MTKKKQKSSAHAAVSTGITSGGTKYFQEDDLMTGDGSTLSQIACISLKLLPTGDPRVMLDPTHEFVEKVLGLPADLSLCFV